MAKLKNGTDETNIELDDDPSKTEDLKQETPMKEKPIKEKNKINNGLEALKRDLVRVTGVGTGKLNAEELELVSNIAEYIEKMSPDSTLTNTEGAMQQLKLFKTLISILSHRPDRFKAVYRWLLDVVAANRKNNGAFSDYMVMRFHSHLNLSVSELNLYRSLVHLVCTNARVTSRKKVGKVIDLPKLIGSMKSTAIQNNLQNLYLS